MHQGPFPASSFVVEDFYQGPAQGTWVLVYAGALLDPATGAVTRGALKVYAEPQVGGSLTLLGTFLAPVGPAPLRVISAVGDRLTLHAAHGASLVFDLQIHKYR